MAVQVVCTGLRLATRSPTWCSSVVAEARKLLELCRSSGAVAAKLGMMDFLRAPDASCSSLLLFADPLSETPQLPMPLLLSDKETFDFQLMARMSATRMECTTAWSVGFFFFDGSSMYGGVKIDEGVFQRLFGVGVAPPPQLLSRDDAEKKQKLRWAKEDRVRFDPTVKMVRVVLFLTGSLFFSHPLSRRLWCTRTCVARCPPAPQPRSALSSSKKGTESNHIIFSFCAHSAQLLQERARMPLQPHQVAIANTHTHAHTHASAMTQSPSSRGSKAYASSWATEYAYPDDTSGSLSNVPHACDSPPSSSLSKNNAT